MSIHTLRWPAHGGPLYSAVIQFPRGHRKQLCWYMSKADLLSTIDDFRFFDQAKLLFGLVAHRKEYLPVENAAVSLSHDES